MRCRCADRHRPLAALNPNLPFLSTMANLRIPQFALPPDIDRYAWRAGEPSGAAPAVSPPHRLLVGKSTLMWLSM